MQSSVLCGDVEFFENYAIIIITIWKRGEHCGRKEGKAICER